MICLQTPFCETNRIEAYGTWNNHYSFSNYFIISTNGEINQRSNLPVCETTNSRSMASKFKAGPHEIVTCSLNKQILVMLLIRMPGLVY